MILDTLEDPGSVMNQINITQVMACDTSARVRSQPQICGMIILAWCINIAKSCINRIGCSDKSLVKIKNRRA